MKHKILTWVVVVFVVFFIVKNPSGAAATARGIGAGLADVATGVGDFFTRLAGGGAR